jgi:beta-N-acetylhexosaminidase
LLKEELGFKGLVVTDAMNMGALSAFPNAPLLAVRAGCDMILMPADEEKLVVDIVSEMNRDENFRHQVEASVRKIIRMKVCLGLLPVL